MPITYWIRVVEPEFADADLVGPVPLSTDNHPLTASGAVAQAFPRSAKGKIAPGAGRPAESEDSCKCERKR